MVSPRAQSGDGLDSSSHCVLIPFVESRRRVKLLVGERIGIGNRALKASTSS
jgi:hypothetical protein